MYKFLLDFVFQFPCLYTTYVRVITHVEPDMLEHEVRWALGSITTNEASGGDGIPVDYFKS